MPRNSERLTGYQPVGTALTWEQRRDLARQVGLEPGQMPVSTRQIDQLAQGKPPLIPAETIIGATGEVIKVNYQERPAPSNNS